MTDKQRIAKFTIQDMLPIGLTLVVLGIGLAYGLQIVGDIQDDTGTTSCAGRSDTFTSYNSTSNVCYNSTGSETSVGTAEFNATGDTITGVAKLPAKLPTIVTVIVAAIIIGILVRYLFVRYS